MSRDAVPEDLLGRPVAFTLAWGIPALVIVAAHLVPMPRWALAVALGGALIWMGIGCFVNARRCRRRHCHYSAPILAVGGVATFLVALGIVDLGRDGLTLVTGTTFAGVALTFVAELIWGRYLPAPTDDAETR